MSGVTAIHYPLRDVYAFARDIHVRIDIRDPVNESAVNAHPQLYLGILSQSATNLDRASGGRFRIAEKHQGHAVARGQPNQFTRGMRALAFGGTPDNFLELAHLTR